MPGISSMPMGSTSPQPQAVTRDRVSCRICPRDNCDQRAFPPTDRPLLIDPDRRGMVPYRIG